MTQNTGSKSNRLRTSIVFGIALIVMEVAMGFLINQTVLQTAITALCAALGGFLANQFLPRRSK